VQVRVRKEIHAWSNDEFASLTEVIRRLKQNGEWDRLVTMHSAPPREAHWHDEFLPWHRLMLEDLETKLQVEDNNCGLTLPYWNWAKEVGDISNSIVWRSDRYGALSSGCVSDGVAENWRTDSGCLNRYPRFRNGILPDWAGLMRNLARPVSFTDMRENVEMPHGSFHWGVGGHMMEMSSPADPIFYAHHAFIDRLWFAWQKNHNDPSCGLCNNLHYNNHLRYSALDYAGVYDPVDDCVKYPPSNPRICLSYSDQTNRRLSSEMREMTEGGDKCALLFDQIDTGLCHYEELDSIARAGECSHDLNIALTEGLEWLRGTLKTQDDINQAVVWKKQYQQQEKMHPRRILNASRPEERRSCVICDVICRGKPVAERNEMVMYSMAFRSISVGMSMLAMLALHLYCY
jgi:hypothetical protein